MPPEPYIGVGGGGKGAGEYPCAPAPGPSPLPPPLLLQAAAAPTHAAQAASAVRVAACCAWYSATSAARACSTDWLLLLAGNAELPGAAPDAPSLPSPSLSSSSSCSYLHAYVCGCMWPARGPSAAQHDTAQHAGWKRQNSICMPACTGCQHAECKGRAAGVCWTFNSVVDPHMSARGCIAVLLVYGQRSCAAFGWTVKLPASPPPPRAHTHAHSTCGCLQHPC